MQATLLLPHLQILLSILLIVTARSVSLQFDLFSSHEVSSNNMSTQRDVELKQFSDFYALGDANMLHVTCPPLNSSSRKTFLKTSSEK